MKGIERQIDKLGRVVLPISFRRHLNLSENSRVHISLDHDTIIITQAKKQCALCGTDLELHSEIQLCDGCIKRVKAL